MLSVDLGIYGVPGTDAASNSSRRFVSRELQLPRLHALELAGYDCYSGDLMALFRTHQATIRNIDLRWIVCTDLLDSGAGQSFWENTNSELRYAEFTVHACRLGKYIDSYHRPKSL